MHLSLFIALLLILGVMPLASCSEEARTPPTPVPEDGPAGTLKGVSLSPRSFEAEDFLEFLDRAGDAGQILMWAGDWAEVSTSRGAPQTVVELASEYDYIPLIEAACYQQSSAQLLRPLDETNRQSYLENAVAFAAKYKPPYFGFGIETNIMHEKSPADFAVFVSFYNEVYAAVKAASPQTKVFTAFQLEKMKGFTFWADAPADPANAEWWMIDDFASDIVAFTTYPGLVYRDPSRIPADYYAEIATQTSKPIAFTEIGWHSDALPSGWGSSEAEQAEFVEAFFTLTEALEPEMVIWSFMYDQAIHKPFISHSTRWVCAVMTERPDRPGRHGWNPETKGTLMLRMLLLGTLMLALLCAGCGEKTSEGQPTALPTREPPAAVPKGILINEIPSNADIIFSSVRYVLDDLACLDSNYYLKKNFILDADCNRAVYDPEGGLACPRQLSAMDIETREATRITNMDCIFTSGQAVDSTTLMTNAVCSDTNGDGKISESDNPDLYLLDLATSEMDCLTCGLGLEAINNPDYSHATDRILFSARQGAYGNQNHLYTIDAARNLVQITDDPEYGDFDCSWSEDGTKIVFNRLPSPAFTRPSQVWLMGSDGGSLQQLTEGGPNPQNEGPHGVFPIGIDADPDLSPDNSSVVISRLRTGKENEPFGVFELVVLDLATKEETVLDSSYANMVPEWKEGGILFTRQSAGDQPMDYGQALWIWSDGRFEELEAFPHNVFPIGAQGGSWIEFVGCGEESGSLEVLPRESKIPVDAVKMTPQTDAHPPILYSDGWEEPVPLPYPISTAGAEDSPFIMPDGQTLYFFFTPDVRVPAEKQLIDGVTGIYVSEKSGSGWGEPERVVLNDDISLDGCEFIQDNIMWFCSARAGYTGVHWFTAEQIGGKWTNWQNADFDPDYEVGELHITADGSELYFHSARPGGKGQYDIWVTRDEGGKWQPPENIGILNTGEAEGWPFLTQDGGELWFLRTYLGSPAIYRSMRIGGEWQAPELIISQFAGEPSLDREGNLYFVHHYYENSVMIEADIYVAKKK